MDVDAQNDIEFQEIEKQPMSRDSSNVQQVSAIVEVEPSNLPDATLTLAELCLSLTTKHYATETIVQ